MTDLIAWIQAHGTELLAAWGALVALASIIVKLTPSQKDDAILGKIIGILDHVSIFNKK